MVTNPDAVSLTTKLTKAHDRLQIRYSVFNDQSKPILVFNRLWSGAGQREADTLSRSIAS